MRLGITVRVGQHKKIGNKITSSLFVVMAVVAITLLAPITSYAEGEAISGGTNVTGNIDTWLEIDGITVAGTTEDPVSVNLSVDSGNLRLPSDTGITYYNSIDVGSNLNITGTITDLNTALGSLQYLNTKVRTVNLTASLSSPGEVYYPGNGHVYEIVFVDGGITAEDARVAAEGRTKYGSQGYLATITSQEENDYVGSRLSGDGWFGASDSTTEDDWQWISGPEAGTSFWAGLGNGTPVSGRYSNWAGGEPNNAGDEDCAQFYSNGGGWNDLPCSNLLSYYVVEYGAEGDLPTVSSTSFTIATTFPEGDPVPVDTCEEITTIVENPLDYRYDDISLTQNIDCAGASIAPMFNTSDEILGRHTFRGTFDGNGYTINNLVISETYDSVGLIRYTDGATLSDVTLGSGVTITGSYCTGGFVGEALNSSFSNVTSNAVVNGDGDSGGMIGCLNADEEGQSSVSNSVISATITSSYAVGGMIGSIDAWDTSEITVNNNTSYSTIVGEEYIGGIIGEVDVDDDASVTISNNLHEANRSGDAYAYVYVYGGILGEVDVDESGSLVVDSNTNTGSFSGEDAEYIGGIIGELYVEEEEASVSINGNVNSGDISSESYTIGGIAGEIDVDEDNTVIIMDNNTNSGDITGEEEVGGLVGISNSVTITNSSSTGTISGYDDPEDPFHESTEIGGLVGDADGTSITNSFATGLITGDEEIGGIIGYADNDVDYVGQDPDTGDDRYELRQTIIRNSYFEGEIRGSDEIGGLVGDNSGSLVEKSYVDADIVGVSRLVQYVYDSETDEETYYEDGIEVDAEDVGGLVGEHETSSYSKYISSLDQYIDVIVPGTISESFATGTVKGGENVGGLVGNLIEGSVVNSYSRSNISVEDDSPAKIGGAIGRARINNKDYSYEYENNEEPVVDKVYATGSVPQSAEAAGGLVGINVDNQYDITDSFWDTQTSGIAVSASGTGKTSTEMKTIETYINLSTDGLEDRWDFNNKWGIYSNINNGYPCLSWSNESCDPNSPDGDEDGISDSEEAAAPNSGDANNDGTPDNQQTNVASFVNSTTGAYTVLETSAECTIKTVSIQAEATNGVQDSGFNYPAGMMNFSIDCGTNGYTATVRKLYYDVTTTASMVVRKYNPNTNAYFNLSGTYGATIQNSTIGGQSVAIVAYQITDGQELDVDSTANGVIVDPVGLATSAVGSPNTGLF